MQLLRYFFPVKWDQSQVVYGGNERLYEAASLCILVMLSDSLTCWCGLDGRFSFGFQFCPLSSFPQELLVLSETKSVVGSQYVQKIHVTPGRG